MTHKICGFEATAPILPRIGAGVCLVLWGIVCLLLIPVVWLIAGKDAKETKENDNAL